METRFAKIISYLFHPIFLPVYCLLLLFNLKIYFSLELILNAKLMLLAFVTITTIVFPMLIIFMMKRQGFILTYQMENRKERRFPYLITAVFYFLTYNMFRQMQLPDMYTLYMMGASAILIAVIIINIWWKISIHMTGIGGALGLITGLSLKFGIDMMSLVMFIVFVAGLLGFARLKLNSHSQAEIYFGFFTGALVMTGIIYFL